MKHTNISTRRLIACFTACAWTLASPHIVERTAYAESYVAGQIGYTLSSDLSSGQLTTPGVSNVSLSDQALSDSLMYGAKVGHYFRDLRWLGIELEIFNTNPHLKQQTTTFSGPGGSVGIPLPGVYQRVLTIAPNLLFRYPGKHLQPYVGIGPGIFLGRIHDPQTGGSQSSTRVGLNAQVGLRYFLTRHVSLFTEGKFNYAKFSYSDEPLMFGFKATYFTQHVVVGLGYHF